MDSLLNGLQISNEQTSDVITAQKKSEDDLKFNL